MALEDKNILVVEDSEISRDLMLNSLNTIGLYNVTMAENGVQALEKIKEAMETGKKFDLIFVDIYMPILNGVALLEKLKSYGLLEQLDVIMITLESDISIIEKVLDLGAKQFIKKPFTNMQLKEVLEGLYGPLQKV